MTQPQAPLAAELQPPVLDLPPLTLETPAAVAPLAASQTRGAVKLNEALRQRIDAQYEDFAAKLLQSQVNTEEFRAQLDKAFALGRAEIAAATTISSSVTAKNFVGEEDTPAYKAIAQMRELFDELNPGNNDLFEASKVFGIALPTKVLGIAVPGSDKLKRYLRRYEAADSQLSALHEQLASAKLSVERSVAELSGLQTKVWDNLQKLEAVVYFMTQLDTRLTGEIDTMRISQPERAKAFEQEVLYYVRQNLGDVQAAQALTINAYQILGELRKTGREVIIGCDRLMTLGQAALSLAVTVARHTGIQLKTHALLSRSQETVNSLMVATGTSMRDHAKATTELASNPVFGIEALKQMFAATNETITIMETFRTNALSVQQANNQTLAGLVATQMAQIENQRSAAGVRL